MVKKPLQIQCSFVSILEEGMSLEKTYMNLEVSLDKGELYLGGKYRFRMKQMTALEMIATDELQTKFEHKSKITSVHLKASPQNDDKQWQDFCKRWQAYFAKIQSNERKSGFGGGTLRKGKVRQTKDMPWDDDASLRRKLTQQRRPNMTPQEEPFKKRATAAVVSSRKEELTRSSLSDAVVPIEHKPVDEDTSQSEKRGEHIDNKRSTEVADTEEAMLTESDDDDMPIVIKKKRRIQRKMIHDDDDSDDGIFTDPPVLTTPAVTNHVVSPGTRATKDTNLEESSDDGETEFQESQPRISSFFAPAKTSTTPSSNKQVLTPTRTPTRSPQPTSSARRAIFTSARKYGVSQRSLDMVNATERKKKPSVDANSWLLNSQTKRAQSSAEKRRPHLFAPSHKELASDPIGETTTPILSTAPTSPKRWRKNSLLNSQRQTGKAGATFTNRPSMLVPSVPEGPDLPRFRGLRNLGNTCYMNASLQMLYTCREFMAALETSRGGDLVQSVCGIYRELQCPNMMAAKPTMIKDAIDTKTDKFLGFEQRDAHEFLADLIDHMDEELKQDTQESDQGKPLPTDDFCLTVRAHLTCTSCGYTRHKDEMHRGLSVEIVEDPTTGRASIDKSIKQFFEPDCRELKCEKCESGSHANQSLSIASFPKILLLHLKRFIFVEQPASGNSAGDSATAENQEPNSPHKPVEMEYVFKKNKAPVAISPNVDLSQYKSSRSGFEASPKTLDYSLKSVVRHIGRMASSGHYTADAIRPEEQSTSGSKEDPFVSFDDHSSRRTTEEDVVGKRRETPYMILYKLNE